MKTRVLFRMFKGEVLALFPAIAATVGKPWLCQSYAHMGQHSGADLAGVMRSSRPAWPSEYHELHRELLRIGYKLTIAHRTTRADLQAREEQLR